MRFTCDQKKLVKVLNIVSKAVSVRTTIPTLKGILLEVKEGSRLFMTASDMDISIEDSIDVENAVPGALVVQARLFGDIIRKLPGSDIEISTEDDRLTIRCLNSEFSLAGMPADEFPNIKNTEEGAKKISFSRSMFSDMIKGTSFAASIDQTKGVITGILIEMKSDHLRMVAIDGYRMAINTEKVANKEENNVIISQRIMNEIGKILTETAGEGDGGMELIFDKKSAVLLIDEIKIVLRLIAGEFIKYEDILPKKTEIEVKLKKDEFTEAAERASLLSKEGKNNLIRLSLRDKVCTITSRSEEGNVREDVLIEKTGQDLDIGFNAKYVLDILRAVPDEELVLKFNTAISPCLVEPTSGDRYKYLILPVRITNM